MDEIVYNTDELREFLHVAGIETIRLTFSGGGDSGGIDETWVRYIGSETEERIDHPDEHQHRTRPDGTYVMIQKLLPTKMVRANNVIQYLYTPIADKYGRTWAGEYSAQGTIDVDLNREPDDQIRIVDTCNDYEGWDGEEDDEEPGVDTVVSTDPDSHSDILSAISTGSSGHTTN